MNHFRGNASLKILALALSVALWANVKLQQEPFTTALALPLQVRNLSDTLVAVPSITQVTAVVYGPKVYLANLTPDQLHAYIDLGTATTGHSQEEVSVEVPSNLKALLRVQAITPNRVDVRLFPKRRQSVPVRIRWTGVPPEGARYGTVRLDPPVVDVAGAENLVAMVDHAEVKVQAGDPHITARFPVVPVDSAGNPVSDVRIWPDGVTVDATLTMTSGRKQAFVSPVFIGSPGPGYETAQVWTQPQVVTLLGPPEVINKLPSVRTKAVDISGKREDVVQTVGLQVPRGVSTVPETVQVRIQLRKTGGRP